MYKPQKVNGHLAEWKNCGLDPEKFRNGEFQHIHWSVIDIETGEEIGGDSFIIQKGPYRQTTWKEALSYFFRQVNINNHHRNRQNISNSIDYKLVFENGDDYYDRIDEESSGEEVDFIF